MPSKDRVSGAAISWLHTVLLVEHQPLLSESIALPSCARVQGYGDGIDEQGNGRLCNAMECPACLSASLNWDGCKYASCHPSHTEWCADWRNDWHILCYISIPPPQRVGRGGGGGGGRPPTASLISGPRPVFVASVSGLTAAMFCSHSPMQCIGSCCSLSHLNRTPYLHFSNQTYLRKAPRDVLAS